MSKTVKTAKTTVNLTNSTVVTKGRGVGRPAFAVKLPSRGKYSLKDLAALNPNVKSMTLRAHVVRGLANGSITKLVRTVKSGRKGKPANLFMSTVALNALKERDAAKAIKPADAVKPAATEPVAA